MAEKRELIQEELEVWIDNPDLEFTEIDNNSNVYTNFLYVNRNFLNLKKWLHALKLYLKYLRSLVDPEAIIGEALRILRENRTQIPVSYSQNIGSKTNVHDNLTNCDYVIERLDQYSVEITNITESVWNVDRLMVQVKNFDGTIVYPVIKTIGNKINIYFADGLSTNYYIYLM